MDAKAGQPGALAPQQAPQGPQLSDAPRDRPFDGWRVPTSAKARELVCQAVRLIEEHEHCHGLRMIARSARHQASFEATVAAIVSDLMHHALSQEPGGIAVTRDRRNLGKRSRYRPTALGKPLPHVLDTMDALGIASVQLGWHDLKPRAERERFRQTTMRAGPWLRERIATMGLGFADLGRDGNGELIILRGTKRPRKGGILRADLMDYPEDVLTVRLRSDMRAINAWLAQADLSLSGASFPHIDTGDRRLRRVFNNARFDHGGRLSGGWWTGLSKVTKREHVRIGGERVALLDFNCLYARLAYARVGVKPPAGDLYTCIPGLEAHRKGAQTLLNALLFDCKARGRKPKGTLERLPEGVPVGELIAAIERTHAPIAGLFGKGVGFELMNVESTIMVRVLLRLRDRSIVGLPVHDALIVARSDADTAAYEMMTAAEEIAGHRLPVSIDDAASAEEEEDVVEDDSPL